ncbi:uncharacterized protein LOC122378680 [Amphibalanus amphitrite]|uniref:uncharacterized protein LOC122378680 n=1 Tax=Amphibalanus amphitrite TaxID=1232801 RepID=UPI001C903EFF|nr:uncharacterized protein LOC122378680 [Amphibalanus amphitrite]
MQVSAARWVLALAVLGAARAAVPDQQRLVRLLQRALEQQLAAEPLQSTANANDYFDRTLANARHLVLDNGLDPLPLPDEKLAVLGTGVVLHDGHLDGLSNVHRTGDAIMSYDGEWLGISGHIGFNGFGAGYSCKIEVIGIGPDVTATATITETSVFFSAKISSQTLAIELVDFKIEQVGTIDVDITGLGIFDWLLEPLTEAIVNLLDGIVVDIINLILEPMLRSFIESIDLMAIIKDLI